MTEPVNRIARPGMPARIKPGPQRGQIATVTKVISQAVDGDGSALVMVDVGTPRIIQKITQADIMSAVKGDLDVRAT